VTIASGTPSAVAVFVRGNDRVDGDSVIAELRRQGSVSPIILLAR
jgi:hypothetical protein